MFAYLVVALLTAAQADSAIVLRNARILDVRTGKTERATLVIDGGVIQARGRNPSYPASARVIAADSLTILPGLIDTHVHLTLAGRPRDNAASTLKAGFTTVADLGSARFGGVRIRKLIDADSAVGPHVIPAGSWIGGRGGVCEFGGATIRGAEEAAALAGVDVSVGARILKLCVSNWLETAVLSPDSVEMTDDEIAAVVDVAKRANVPVVAHALGERSVNTVMRAGVRWLAHTPIVSGATAAEMARQNVCVSTTLTSLGAADRNGALRASFERLRHAGVRLVLGTDAGVVPHGSNATELTTLTQYGLTPLEAIQAATSSAAACLGIADYGRLLPGERADLIALTGDPVADPRALREPAMVIRSGRIVSPMRPGS